MADRSIVLSTTVTSVNGSQSNGTPINIAGYWVDVQTHGPAGLGIVEVSNDKLAWIVATDRQSNATSSLNSVHVTVEDRAMWLRVATASDGSGPRAFPFNIVIHKDN